MANIFKEQKAVNEHPNRNNFDLSKKSNLSMKFGTLYPVYCQPVVPGDSFSIDTAFNLKLQPVVFPVQSKMRAHMHYFYVRNKNIWSNWENWISNLVSNSEHPHPYISTADKNFKSGSIHDFLGVPTSLVTDGPAVASMVYHGIYGRDQEVAGCYVEVDTLSISGTPADQYSPAIIYGGINKTIPSESCNLCFGINCKSIFSPTPSQFWPFLFEYKGSLESRPTNYHSFGFTSDSVTLSSHETEDEEIYLTLDLVNILSLFQDNITVDYLNSRIALGFNIGIGLVPALDDYSDVSVTSKPPVTPVVYNVINQSGFYQYSDLGLNLYTDDLHINALPYRAYESIYYCYYNNNVLNPLKINNQVQYNRYNTELGDGADTTNYHLFQRNYELDFLTSALPSPQQGVAPVVGMTALGDVTIEDENGITTAHATIDNDGTISKVVLTSPAASVEHARTAMNIAACGMSISDFRNTNALQRFLETNIRKGYRYMDFIAGHFGKEPEYRELDLPEFIGGFSRDVSVSTVVSNADTLTEGSDYGAALGQYGGYAQVVGSSNHSVRHYCDDYGYIIGILSVVPTPCYSQLLPKHMIAPVNFLDYYFPEFSSTGLQPITYKEVCPIQSFIDGLSDSDKRLEDTFGYQRPNYDLVSAVDELHGDFRGSLRNYVINRVFDTRPELGQSFISINPSEINDIFVDTNSDEDTILGEIGFSVHAKRPIPRVVIPNLGK